jgi:hypothetical protein
MSIQSFITNFRGGTRKNRFRVTCTIPGFTIPPPPTGSDNDYTPIALQSAGPGEPSAFGGFDDFHVLAAALPTSIITTNPIDYQGRRILYPGDRIYSGDGFNVWTVTIQDDIPSSVATQNKLNNLWTRLHGWSNGINSHRYNTGNTKPITETDITVDQLNLNDTGVPLKRAILKNAWPQSISPIDMEMQARDQYNTFDVTFCFKYVIYE